MGSVYKRGCVWWISYYHRGKQIRESAETERKTVAERLLKLREGEIAKGKLPGVMFEKITFDDLYTDLKTNYQVNERKNRERAEGRIDKHLVPFFGGFRVPEITSAKVMEYINRRLAEGAASGTVNRELTLLKRMLSLGAKQTPPKVDRVPHIPMLSEASARRGFFEAKDFEALRAELPDHLQGPATFAYRTGWRLAEVLGLTWDRVDREGGFVRLESGQTKNEEARNLYLDPVLRELLEERWKARKVERRKGRRGGLATVRLDGPVETLLSPYVFHRAGYPVRNYYPAWRKACHAAELDGRLFHDFRRTAVRNMVRAGVPEKVAMTISGHKTRSVFERYNIVSGEDLKAAAEKQAEYLAAQHDKHNSKHSKQKRGSATGTPSHRKPSK